MWNISGEVKKAAETVNVQIKEIQNTECNEIIENIKNKYCLGGGGVLWEKMNDYVSVCDSNGWQWINEFVGKEESIMFFNESDEKKSFVFKDGTDLTTILSETYGFEFYITNKQTSFLIAFNHHDCLIACGTAKKWLKSKVNDCQNC